MKTSYRTAVKGWKRAYDVQQRKPRPFRTWVVEPDVPNLSPKTFYSRINPLISWLNLNMS